MTTKIPAELSSTPGISDSSNATAITIDSSERVGIGTTSPEEFLQVHGGIKTTGGFLANTANSMGMSYASNYAHFISWGDNSTQGKFKFTGTAGDGSPTGDLASLDSDGLKFGSDTAAANALDDYEEGTWSPHIYSVATNNQLLTATDMGKYIKVGRLVFITLQIYLNSVSAVTTSSSGNYMNLPFSASNTAITGFNATKFQTMYYNGMGTINSGYLSSNTNKMFLATSQSNPLNNLAGATTISGSVRFYGSMVYSSES